MTLNFDTKGNLVPNSNIKCSLELFRKVFVEEIATPIRASLYESFLRYTSNLKDTIDDAELICWINGSFATKKKEPNDLDLVTFINYDIIDQKEQFLQDFKYPNSLTKFGLDAYIVKVYPRTHIKYPLYIGDEMYWMDKFDKNKRNRNGVKVPKGFVEIIL